MARIDHPSNLVMVAPQAISKYNLGMKIYVCIASILNIDWDTNKVGPEKQSEEMVCGRYGRRKDLQDNRWKERWGEVVYTAGRRYTAGTRKY